MILLQKWLTLHSALPGNGLVGLNLRLQHGARGAASQGAAGMGGMVAWGKPLPVGLLACRPCSSVMAGSVWQNDKCNIRYGHGGVLAFGRVLWQVSPGCGPCPCRWLACGKGLWRNMGRGRLRPMPPDDGQINVRL